MPEVSRFYGIIIQIYFGDHPPPHFHALYGEHTAVVEISNSAVLQGYLPPRAMSLVTEWVSIHRDELLHGFTLAQQMERPPQMAPLP